MPHTPGPWYRNINAKYPVFAGDAPNHSHVASILQGGRHGISSDEAEANLRLVAAAPELLDALKSALSWITVLTETSPSNAEDMRETEHKRAYLCDELRAAIAKATEPVS